MRTISQVLRRTTDSFDLEYPCPTLVGQWHSLATLERSWILLQTCQIYKRPFFLGGGGQNTSYKQLVFVSVLTCPSLWLLHLNQTIKRQTVKWIFFNKAPFLSENHILMYRTYGYQVLSYLYLIVDSWFLAYRLYQSNSDGFFESKLAISPPPKVSRVFSRVKFQISIIMSELWLSDIE